MALFNGTPTAFYPDVRDNLKRHSLRVAFLIRLCFVVRIDYKLTKFPASASIASTASVLPASA